MPVLEALAFAIVIVAMCSAPIATHNLPSSE